jgi:PEP-CTERM motif
MKIPFVTMLGAAWLLLLTGLAGAITLQIDPSNQDVTTGSTVNAELVVSGLGSAAAPSLSTFDLDVTFDDSILSFLDFTFGDPILGDQLDLSSLGSITAVSPGVGTVNLFELSFDTSTDLDTLQAGSFTLGTLRFGALSTGVSAIGISVNALGDANGDPLTAEIVGGRVAVSAAQVPEPASVLLLLAGVVGFAGFRARETHRESARPAEPA